MQLTLSANSTSVNRGFQLCANGDTHTGLHQPFRLRDLYQAFEFSVQLHCAKLIAEFHGYQKYRGKNM